MVEEEAAALTVETAGFDLGLLGQSKQSRLGLSTLVRWTSRRFTLSVMHLQHPGMLALLVT